MSHFTVGVILENPKGDNEKFQRELEKALEPFQENNEGDCPKQYLQFNSVTEEEKENYGTGTITKVRCPDGKLVCPWDEMFRVKGTIGICFGSERSHKVPENAGFEEVEIPYKELYPTFEQYIEESCGYKLDEEMQDYGYWENPNAKWDWWSVGGRWRDTLLVKGEDYIKGERSFFNLSEDKQAPDGYTWASGGRIGDIDFKKSMQGEYEKAIRFWEIVVDGQPLKDGEKEPFNVYKHEYYIEQYGTKENYAEQQSTFSTYALLIDGKWISRGEMGWFGVDDSTKERKKAYLEKFKEVMSAEENQDKLFVVVDCHI